MRTEDVDEATEYLYETLVRSSEEPEPAERLVQRFREELKAKKLDKNRLLRQDEYVDLPNGEAQLFHWQYDRNHGSNERVLIEPIQWLGRIRFTQLELEHVLSAVQKVRAAHLPAHLVVVMDEVEPPSPGARDATKRLYDNYVDGQKTLRQESDEVIARIDESQNLVERIETDLREMLQHPA
jgi:hypothetical protein